MELVMVALIVFARNDTLLLFKKGEKSPTAWEEEESDEYKFIVKNYEKKTLN